MAFIEVNQMLILLRGDVTDNTDIRYHSQNLYMYKHDTDTQRYQIHTNR